MKMEETQCSETSAIKHHAPDNNPKGYTRHSENGESLKSSKTWPVIQTFASHRSPKWRISQHGVRN
jgi:hypothetical protein